MTNKRDLTIKRHTLLWCEVIIIFFFSSNKKKVYDLFYISKKFFNFFKKFKPKRYLQKILLVTQVSNHCWMKKLRFLSDVMNQFISVSLIKGFRFYDYE